MPETTVGLPDNNLFGNLIANTRPSANNPGSQILNINSIQSDTKAGDVENIDDIPFQEILGQHIFNLNIYNPFPNAHNGRPPTSPFVPFSQRESEWGFGERIGINAILDKQLTETHNPSSIFSLEKSNVNAVDEMDKPFIQDMDIRNTLPKTDTLKLNPQSNPETPQVSGKSSLNNMQQADLYSSDSSEINMKELPETYKQLAQNISPENKNGVPIPAINNSSNAKEQLTENGLSKINGAVSLKQDVSSISQTNEAWNSFDSHTQKQNTSDTLPFDAHIPKSNNGSPFSLDSQTTVSNAQSNVTDFQQNTQTHSNNGAALSSSTADAKTVNHMFHSNDVSGVEHAQENIMEQIFQKIRITTHGDRSEIKLSLNPPELGNVKIHFTEESGEIEAKIFVENAEVKAAIENNAHRLKESAATSGIEIHKLEVYIQNNDANKQASIENFNTDNPHQNHTFSQNGSNEDHAGNEENMNDQQIEIRRNTSNLMVDYII